MSVVTLLNAVSANTTGPVAGLGTPYGNLTLAVSTTGTVSAFSVVLQGSLDGFNWEAIGSAVTSPTAGTSMGTGVLFQYFQAVLSGYSGTGTVTAELAYSLEAQAGGGGPPSGAAGGVLTGTYPNPGLATVTIGEGGTGQITAAAAYNALSPMTTLGDLEYESGTDTASRLAGNTTATKKFLTQTGAGGVSAAPGWNTIAAGDVPTLNQGTTGNAATATNLAGGATLPDYLAPAVVSLAFGSSIAVNAASGNDFRLTLTASTGTVAAPSSPVDGQTIKFQITQGSGGSFTLAWNAVFNFGVAGAPVLSTVAGDVDIVGFVYNAALTAWCCAGSALGF